MAWQAKHLCHSCDFVCKGQVFQPAHQVVSHNDQQTTVVAAKIFRTDRSTRAPHRTVSVLGTFAENSRRFGKLPCQTIELIQYKLLCLCCRACKGFRIYRLDHVSKYEIEDHVSHYLGIHRDKKSIESMHKEAERTQGELGLIDIVKILVAESPSWNRLIRALNILSEFESCIDNLRCPVQQYVPRTSPPFCRREARS